MALMQHFSAPTRMLDWTSSFTVALYFAVCQEPIEVPGAVWLVHAEPLRKWMYQKYPDPELKNDDARRAILDDRESFIEFGLHQARPWWIGTIQTGNPNV
jgi:FRG domain-containing protein